MNNMRQKLRHFHCKNVASTYACLNKSLDHFCSTLKRQKSHFGDSIKIEGTTTNLVIPLQRRKFQKVELKHLKMKILNGTKLVLDMNIPGKNCSLNL